jgi:hypothetical protein
MKNIPTTTLRTADYNALLAERDELANCLLCHRAVLMLLRDDLRRVRAKLKQATAKPKPRRRKKHV